MGVEVAKLTASEQLLHLFAGYRVFILCTTGPNLPSFIMCLQIAFSVWLAFANSESPIIDQGLLLGGCFKYRSMAPRIARSEETLNSLHFFCRTEA